MHFFDGDNRTIFDNAESECDRMSLNKYKFMTAQKCTFCAHRIDSALEKKLIPGVDRDATPACVITCPAECRIFGDLEDDGSPASQYLKKAREDGRSVFKLREEVKTGPSVIYVK
jgi:phenylacetyl-CoA:acceptor oxidoreductase subunit 1